MIVKSCQFSSAAVTGDGEVVYAVGSDGYVREMRKGSIDRELMFLPNGVDALTLSNSDMMLFASGNDGTIYSIKLPILDSVKYLDCAVHSMPVYHVINFIFNCSSSFQTLYFTVDANHLR